MVGGGKLESRLWKDVSGECEDEGGGIRGSESIIK